MAYTIGDLLPLLRNAGYDYNDEQDDVIIAPECEEWTWVRVNLSSWILDALSDCIVETIDTQDGELRIWVKTSRYGVFAQRKNEE